MEYSNGTAEAYRYHQAPYEASTFVGPTAAYCNNGTNGSLPPPPPLSQLSSDAFQAGAPPSSRRFHPYLNGESHHHSSPGPLPELLNHHGGYTNGGGFGPATNGGAPTHHCDQCGSAWESVQALNGHIQQVHQGYVATSYVDGGGTYPPPPSQIKGETSETAEILDLDSHKVHVYQPPGSVGPGGIGSFFNGAMNGAIAPTPPYTPATSNGSASNSSSLGWMTPTPPLPSSLAPPPPLLHPNGQHQAAPDYRQNPYPSYDLTTPSVNIVSVNNNNNNNNHVNGTGSNNNGVAKSSPGGWKPNPPPTGGGPPSNGGGSEARRPKTYNCEACNKWFTSSGHLKRHYNTTLHKNAVKTTGGSVPSGNGASDSNGQAMRSATPSSRSTGTPNGVVNSPAGSDESNNRTPMEDTALSRSGLASPVHVSKAAMPPSPIHNNGPAVIGDYRPPSQHQPSSQPPPMVAAHHQHVPQMHGQQQQTLQHQPPFAATAPYQQQQVPSASSAGPPMDPYRSTYSAPNGSQGAIMMAPTANTNGQAYYCPPNGNGQTYPPAPVNYPPQQPHLGYAPNINNNNTTNNNIGYPPNSIAPPPSSNVNGQQLAAGPTASHGIAIGLGHNQAPLYPGHHDVSQQPTPMGFINTMSLNNNNNIVDQHHHHHHVKEGDADVYRMKSMPHESDFSGGSDGSPVASDDASLDVSDADDSQEKLTLGQLAPTNGVVNGGSVNGFMPVPTNNNGISNGKPAKRGRAVMTPTPSDVGATAGIFKCTLCDKAFNRVCYLTQHNNTFHKGDKPFKCHMCGKRFPNAELFDQHQQKHAGDKPYKCQMEYCTKQFNHKTDLRRHMCLHTGQKPFTCQVCSKGFIRKDHMVKHVQTHTRRNALHAHPQPTASSI